jgi:hypothetical protein
MQNIFKKLLNKKEAISDCNNLKKWNKILSINNHSWSSYLKNAKNGDRILIATSMGCYEHATITESALAVALTLRGACIDVLLCDKILPCCQMTKIGNIQPKDLLKRINTPRCKTCYQKGKKIYHQLNLNVYGFSDFLDNKSLKTAEILSEKVPFESIEKYKYIGLAVGEHALAGALRYYARGDLEDVEYSEPILRRFLKSSLLTAMATQGAVRKCNYAVAVFHHGIYVPQGLIGEVCRAENIRVVNWNPSYRKQTFIFSHNDSYHHSMITESTKYWKNIEWNEKIEKQIMGYLKSRWYGSEDWIWFHEKPVEETTKIALELGIDFTKTCIGMLSSVMWDAKLHYKSNAFNDMLDWVFQTIEYFESRKDLQLILRVHPAETRGLVKSNQKLLEEIKNEYKNLSNNIFIIPPESKISTYAVMKKCNSVIIYNTKTGIEISSMGIPVIVAGEAWIRNKGFSFDACTPSEYFDILDELPFKKGLSKEKLLLARKYAYYFFFQRMIELPFIYAPKKLKFALNLKEIEELLPGRYKGLDIICDGILEGKEFVYTE